MPEKKSNYDYPAGERIARQRKANDLNLKMATLFRVLANPPEKSLTTLREGMAIF